MIVCDFEVFKFNWLAVFYDLETKQYTTISKVTDLKKYYYENERRIFIGYNIKHYDQYIFKSLLLDIDVKKVNDYIIKEGKKGYTYSTLFSHVDLIVYDVYNGMHSLKEIEGFMGNSILECSVPFDIDRPLLKHEFIEVEKYCKYDVYSCAAIFAARIDDFKTHLALIKEFNLPLSCLSKTKPQIIALILGAYTKKKFNDTFDITIPDNLKLKNIESKNFYLQNEDYTKYIELYVCGVLHKLAYGGLHGARENYMREGVFLHLDVGSYYPSLMLLYNFISRNCSGLDKYKSIYDRRFELKELGDKKEKIYKLVLNMAFGAMKDIYNNLYDPKNANNVCICGQLFLLDLLEDLEGKCELVQSNTDGIIIRLIYGVEDLESVMDVVGAWEKRTGFKMGFCRYNKVIQKDVNNYILVDEFGEIKTKGAYVKPLDRLNFDLPIVNKAIIEYFVNNVDVETTIEKENELIMFQKVTKITRKFDYIYHGEKRLNEKCVRYFASNDSNDGGLYKSKGDSLHKISNSPEHCFMMNSSIEGVNVSRKLDKSWYINLAKKRISDFLGGVLCV